MNLQSYCNLKKFRLDASNASVARWQTREVIGLYFLDDGRWMQLDSNVEFASQMAVTNDQSIGHGFIDIRTHVGIKRIRFSSNEEYCRDYYTGNQRQHDRIFDRGWAIFVEPKAMEEVDFHFER